MTLRFAIAALLFCTLLIAGPQAGHAQQKIIGPLRLSTAAPAPTPIPLPLPGMANATPPAPAPAAAPTAPSPGVATVNPRPTNPRAVNPPPANAAPVVAQSDAQQPSYNTTTAEIDERPKNAVAFYVGRSATTNFTDILIKPWATDFEDTAIVALTYNRRLFTVIEYLDIEGEVGIAKRFGESEAWEINTSILLRWTWFPWNDTVKTTLGIALFGPSYATDISATEKDKSGNDKGNRFLNFFAPELTFADPDNPDLEFIFRLHHRSGIFGVYEGVDGGSTFISTGLRYRF